MDCKWLKTLLLSIVTVSGLATEVTAFGTRRCVFGHLYAAQSLEIQLQRSVTQTLPGNFALPQFI